MLFDLKDIDQIYPFIPGLRAGEIKKINTTQRFTTSLRPAQKEKIIDLYKEDYKIRSHISQIHNFSLKRNAPHTTGTRRGIQATLTRPTLEAGA